MPTILGNHDQAELIALAIAGIDAQVRELQEKRAALTRLATSGGRQARSTQSRTASSTSDAAPKKRVFSAATRKRLSLAAKRRWARARAAKKGKGSKAE